MRYSLLMFTSRMSAVSARQVDLLPLSPEVEGAVQSPPAVVERYTTPPGVQFHASLRTVPE